MRVFPLITAISLILILIFFLFSPSLKNGFVNWDDPEHLTENTMVKVLSWESVKKIFTSFYTLNYHPLALLSYALEYHFFGLNSFVYHSTNLVLHLLNSLLVFWLISMLTGRITVSFITAILFGIHPLHVESVAWVCGRREILYSVFFLGSIIEYLYYRRDKVVRYYYYSLFLFILAVLSKAVAVNLPFVLLLCDYFIEGRLKRENWIKKTLYFGIAIIGAMITFFARKDSGDIGQIGVFQIIYNLCIASHSLVFYLVKMAAPVRLSVVYPYPSDELSKLPWGYLISPLIVLLLVLLVKFSLRWTKKVVFGSLFFLITVLPVLQILRSVTAFAAADRYTYIPLLGMFYIIGEGWIWLYRRKMRYKRVMQISLVAGLTVIICIFSLLTYQRIGVWKDSIILWSDVLKNYPDFATAYKNRGVAYTNIENFNQAILDFNRAIYLAPGDISHYVNIGNAYASKGDFTQAVYNYNKALEIDSKNAWVYYNRAAAYLLKQEFDNAWDDVRKAERLGYKVNPEFLVELRKTSGRER